MSKLIINKKQIDAIRKLKDSDLVVQFIRKRTNKPTKQKANESRQ